MSEEERCRFYTDQIDAINNKWNNLKWIRKLEDEHNLLKSFGVPSNAMQLYWDARSSFTNHNYLSTLIVIGSCVEATIFGSVDPLKIDRDILDENKEDPGGLTLWLAINLVKDKVVTEVFNELHDFRRMRNLVVHSKFLAGPLSPWVMVNYRGSSTKSRGATFLAPDLLKIQQQLAKGSITEEEAAELRCESKMVSSYSPKEVAEMGFKLFFQVREVFLEQSAE